MIVILTGSTGKIGGAVLKRCLESFEVSEIFALTRRPLHKTLLEAHPQKLKNIIHKDFQTYPSTLLDQLVGADTCIWALGDPFSKNVREIDVEYTLKAAEAFLDKLQPRLDDSKKFKFVFVSGKFAEVNQDRSLWMLPTARHAKGEAETKLLQLAQSNNDRFEVSIVRPGVVYGANALVPDSVVSLMDGIRDNWLANAILDIAQHGQSGETILNDKLVKMGKL